MRYLCEVKTVVAILLCLSIFAQGIAHLLVVGLFHLNKEYIAKNLCENRDKPAKKCCGKCYLKKQLKKVSEQDENAPGTSVLKIEKLEIACWKPTSFTIPAHLEFSAPASQTPVVPHFNTYLAVTSVFHPPATAA